MRRFALVLAGIHVVLALAVPCASHAATLNNPGFEAGAPAAGFPTTLGNWAGDLTATVTAENGITPPEQDRMLKFLATLEDGGGLVSTWCQIYQLIDVSQEAPSGEAEAVAAVRVNRVDGVDVDTRFFIRILAYNGLPASFPTQRENGLHLDRRDAAIVADADPGTWQLIAATMTLPADTKFIAVGLFADENVVDDATDEFAGHYADDVTVMVTTPTPVAATTWSGVKAIFR